MASILESVMHDLEEMSDPARRESGSRFFKEPVRSRGVRTTDTHTVARRYWTAVAPLGRSRGLALCEELYRNGYLEDGFVAADWAARLGPVLEPGDIHRFGTWVDRYIENWAACDSLCNHAVGDPVTRFPETVNVLKEWTHSRNRWMRRAAAVSLVVPAKRGFFLDDALAIADLLLVDDEDLVRKGYGWLLKEASRNHRDEVFAFVFARRATMPRTALRYAVELMPPDLRSAAMMRE